MRLFKGSRISSIIIGLVLAKLLVAGFYLVETMRPIRMVHLNPGVAVAQAKTPAAQGTSSAAAGPASASQAKAAPGEAQAPLLQPKDIQAVMDTLEKKRQSLQAKEAELKKEQAHLEALKSQIEDKIATLTKIQKKIEDDLNRKDALASQAQQQKKAEEQKHIKQLVKIYTSMKPRNAAAIVDKMDLKVVFEIFRAMRGQQAGQILTYVSKERAATITEWLATKQGQL
jgi:flagellar motility protein MotE (MotC chaperone)